MISSINRSLRDEFKHKKDPYAVPRFAKSTNNNMVWSFNYWTSEYDRLITKAEYLNIKMKSSKLHDEKEIPYIFNAQISVRSNRSIDIIKCFMYAVTQKEAIKILKSNFKSISNIAFEEPEELKKYVVSFRYKGVEQLLPYLAPNKEKARLCFRHKHKNDIQKKFITDIITKADVQIN